MGWFSSACSWVGDKVSKTTNWVKDNAVTIVSTVAATAAVMLTAPVSLTIGAALLTVGAATASGALAGGLTGGIKSKLEGKSFSDGAKSGAWQGAKTGAISGVCSVGFGVAGEWIGSKIGGSIGASSGAKTGELVAEKLGESLGGAFSNQTFKTAVQTTFKVIGKIQGTKTGQIIGKEVGKKLGSAMGLFNSNQSQAQEEEEIKKKEQEVSNQNKKQNEAKKSNDTGDELFKTGKYEEAKEKYQQAYDKSQVKENYSNYHKNIDKAQNEIKAKELNREGNRLFKDGKYQESISKYDEAYTISKTKSEYDVYNSNRINAERELQAAKLYSEANNLVKIGRLNEALGKYSQASEVAVLQSSRIKYESSKNQVQEKIESRNLDNANKINSDGMKLYQVGKYSEAKKCFKEAIALCPPKYKDSADSFEKNLKQTRTEIKSQLLRKQGDELFKEAKYQESISKYDEAKKISEVTERKERYQSKINLAQQKINDLERLEISRQSIIKLSDEGMELYSQGKYEEAKEKLTQACAKISLINNRSYYFIRDSSSTYNLNKNLEKIQIEIEASSLSKAGDILFAEGKYNEAVDKYNNAYLKSLVNKERTIYNEKKIQTEIEIEASKIHQEAEKSFTGGYYYSAKSKYQEAISKTIVQKEKFAKDLHDTQCEIDAKNFNQQGNTLFEQGKYAEALKQYSDAYTKSTLKAKEYLIYSNNKKKAQLELDVVSKNSEGDKLLELQDYVGAIEKYKETINTSSSIQKDICISKQKASESKFIEYLKHLINEGFVLENTDNPEEAERIFDKVQALSKSAVELCPNNKSFQECAKVAELKIEGNRIFNEANVVQATSRLEQLKNIDKQYELAERKYQEGVKYDKNFISSLETIKECRLETQQEISEICVVNKCKDNLQFSFDIYSDTHRFSYSSAVDEMILQGEVLQPHFQV